MKTRELKVLQTVYRCTDCCNEVYDYASLHRKQAAIAEELVAVKLVAFLDGVVVVDGDGFIKEPEREGRGYRLTLAGYEALTAWHPGEYPATHRRFAALPPAVEKAMNRFHAKRRELGLE